MQWHPDGSELFYFSLEGRTLKSVAIKNSTPPEVGEPIDLFEIPESIGRREFDVARDGQRFLMVQIAKDATERQIWQKPSVAVIENWFEEFRRSR